MTMARITTLSALCILIATGGYVSKLVSIENCRHPNPPYAKKRDIENNLVLLHRDNGTVISGNVTVNRPCNNCKWVIQVFRETKGKKRVLMRFKDMNCHDIIIKLIFKLCSIDVDPQTCHVKLGKYVIKEIDLNHLEKKMRFPFPNNGIYYFHYSLHAAAGTYVCWETKSIVTVSKNAKNIWI